MFSGLGTGLLSNLDSGGINQVCFYLILKYIRILKTERSVRCCLHCLLDSKRSQCVAAVTTIPYYTDTVTFFKNIFLIINFRAVDDI